MSSITNALNLIEVTPQTRLLLCGPDDMLSETWKPELPDGWHVIDVLEFQIAGNWVEAYVLEKDDLA